MRRPRWQCSRALELVEHDDLERAGASSYTGVTLASEGTACWRARARRDSERYGRGSGERVALGNFRSATAAAVAVAQWERDHPCADSVRGVLVGFSSPGQRSKTTENALQAISRALRVQSGASPPQTNDFGTSSEDD